MIHVIHGRSATQGSELQIEDVAKNIGREKVQHIMRLYSIDNG